MPFWVIAWEIPLIVAIHADMADAEVAKVVISTGVPENHSGEGSKASGVQLAMTTPKESVLTFVVTGVEFAA